MNQFNIIRYEDQTYAFEYPRVILEEHVSVEVLLAPTEVGNVAVVSNNPRKFKQLLDAASQRGLAVAQINPSILLKRFDILVETAWSYIIVSVDDCGGLGKVYDAIRRFRDSYPQTTVILVSADFSKNDLSCERLPLCDISLKSDAGPIDGVFEVATLNNIKWQARVLELYTVEDDAIFPEYLEVVAQNTEENCVEFSSV